MLWLVGCTTLPEVPPIAERPVAEDFEPVEEASQEVASKADLALLEDRFVTASGRNIDLRIYSEPENIDKCDHAMRSLINAMRWDEQNYGREYDLDVYNIVAVNDFNMGAMENKGLNIFNDRLILASPDTATDTVYERIESVVADATGRQLVLGGAQLDGSRFGELAERCPRAMRDVLGSPSGGVFTVHGEDDRLLVVVGPCSVHDPKAALEYAERLLEDLDLVDWPEPIKTMQTNWIGRSEGASVVFKTEDGDPMEVFTTRPDTLWGATFMVLAPEHPLVDKLTADACQAEVQAYKFQAARQSEIERLSTEKEKTGVFIGAYAVNPVNEARIPIWIADYVMMTYGTGAIMAVPAHDERDFQFAIKYGLAIIPVIDRPDGAVKSFVMQDAMKEGFADALACSDISFEEQDGETIARDQVDYSVPGGALVHWLLVKSDVRRIFEYRIQILTRRFAQRLNVAPNVG